jgi:hypothetical protein
MNEKTTSIVDEVEMHGQTVKRFQSLCDMHRVPFGDPGNLNDLITNLQQNRHFAMDFWAMVGDFSARERGTLSDEEMLEAVVEGSCGMSLAVAEKDYEKPLHELRQMLAGVDVAAPELPAPIAEPKDESFSTEKMDEERAFAQKVLRRKAQAAPEVKVQRPPDVRTGGPSETVTHQVIAEALERLEQSNRELREQIAAMKQETTRNSVPLPVSGEWRTSEQNSAPAENPVGSQPQQPQPPRIVEVPQPPSEQEVFAPRPIHRLSRRGPIFSDPDDDPSISIPLAAYSEESSPSKAIRIGIPVFLLLLAVAAWFAVSRGYGRQMVEHSSPWMKEKWSLFQQEWQGLTGGKTQNSVSAQPANHPAQPASNTLSPSNPVPVQSSPAVTTPPLNPSNETNPTSQAIQKRWHFARAYATGGLSAQQHGQDVSPARRCARRPHPWVSAYHQLASHQRAVQHHAGRWRSSGLRSGDDNAVFLLLATSCIG